MTPGQTNGKKKRKTTKAVRTLLTSIEERRHIGSKSREPRSPPEDKREASVGQGVRWVSGSMRPQGTRKKRKTT
eukprot:735104-Pelagomonas_calceolata.AAC.1